MNKEFWKKHPPIPGFDCVAMKHRIQEKIYEETKHMSMHEFMEYCKRQAAEYEASNPAPVEGMAVKEDPAKYGKS